MKISLLVCTILAGASVATSQAATITLPGDAIKGGELVTGTFTEAPTTGQNNGTNNTPAGEAVASVIDGAIGTKYLNFGREDTGYIVIPAIGSSIVTGIDFVTANDDIRRDPASYILYGSNALASLASTAFTIDGDGFTQISAGTLSLPKTGTNLTGTLTNSEGRGHAASISFTNTLSYTSYILVFPTVHDAATNSMQIAEARLTGTALVPEPAAAGFLAMASLGLVLRRRR